MLSPVNWCHEYLLRSWLRDKKSRLLIKGEMAPAVLLPTRFVGFGAERFFLAPACGHNLVRRNAEADEILLDGVGRHSGLRRLRERKGSS